MRFMMMVIPEGDESAAPDAIPGHASRRAFLPGFITPRQSPTPPRAARWSWACRPRAASRSTTSLGKPLPLADRTWVNQKTTASCTCEGSATLTATSGRSST